MQKKLEDPDRKINYVLLNDWWGECLTEILLTRSQGLMFFYSPGAPPTIEKVGGPAEICLAVINDVYAWRLLFNVLIARVFHLRPIRKFKL